MGKVMSFKEADFGQLRARSWQAARSEKEV